MLRRLIAVSWTVALLAAGVGLLLSPVTGAAAEKKPTPKPLKKLPLDPNAAEVELFDAIESGQLAVRVVPKNSTSGNVFIENKTDKPLTVKLPEAVVAVPKHLAQFGGGGMGGMGMGGMGGGMGGMGGMGMGGMGGGMGGMGGQAMGGGMGGGMMGGGCGGGMMGGMGGFGSIPPETVAAVPLHAVCLQHGKPDPTPRNDYVLIPVENFTQDPVLMQMLRIVATGQVDSQAAQAATWHLTDKLTWEQLAIKTQHRLGGGLGPRYFNPAQLEAGYSLLNAAKELAEEAPPMPKPRKPVLTAEVSATTK
jgi:hypothetical protein